MLTSLTLNVQVTPPVMLRQRHVLLLLKDQNKRFVFGMKNIYPPGIVRMVGGGVEKSESFLTAASRELYEELRYFAGSKELILLTNVRASITDAQKTKFLFETAIYFVELKRKPVFPSDDLDGIVRFSKAEFLRLIQRYKKLPKEIDPEFGFSWYDYGQLYGKLHQIAFEALEKREHSKLMLI